MKYVLTILLLAYSTVSFGQKPSEANSVTKKFENISGLSLIDTLKTSDAIGTYFISNGFTGYRLMLDSNHTFQKIGFDCVSHSKVDSGEWRLKDGTELLLISGKTTKIYDVVKLDNYYFIIPEHQRQTFIKDYQATKAKFKNAKPFRIGGKEYLVEYMIGFSLIEKYFAKDLNDITGT